MHTIIPTYTAHTASTEEFPAEFRQPHFECTELPQALKIEVLVPGVDPASVDITTRGPDLVLVAHKKRHVRVNWQSAHLEAAQRDYALRLRLGLGFDYANLRAALREGILTLVLPKKNNSSSLGSVRRVA
jgi:HSP20 family molecular chaperone IbpA